MSTAKTPPQAFPAVPPSLNPEDYELRNYYHDNSVPPPAHTIPYYTPYLGLQARLSQVWINRWTILLALVLCRLLLAVKEINYDIARAKEEALSACTSVENIGSAMASMPHYMSEGVNALAADGVTKAFQGLMDMLSLTVTGVEEILLFIINMYTSTYLCLITLAITGSLHVAIDMIEKVGNAMNQTIKGITGDLSTVATDFESGLNSFLSGLSIPASIFGSTSAPKIDISKQITELNSITIDPTTLDADLTKLNNSIPTFAQVQNLTDNVIRTPFEYVKQALNDSAANYTFDRSIFAVAPKKALTFCSDNTAINDFFDGLAKAITMARTIFIIVITILAVLACVPMAYREIWRWRTLKQRSQLVAKNAYDPMDVIYMASRPYTSTAGIKAATVFTKTKNVILTRWFVAYATTTPALFVLALGVAGLFTNLCQYIVLKIIEKEVPALADQVGEFAQEVVTALNNASESWAVAANGVISSTNTKVNNDVFGWVNTSTTAVNNTLNTFVDEMTKELNATFGGTILYDPITEVINCLIGLKITGIEKALTWVHDNAHVTFPEFRTDVFSLGAAASLTNSSATESFLSSPGDVAADDITNAVVKMSNKLQQQIRTEVIISSALVGCWVLIVLIGLFSALFMMMVRDKTRGEGGAVRYTGDNRTPITPRGRADESRFPEFGGPVSSVHPQFSNDNMYAAGEMDEKLGSAGHRSVEASYKPGHDRTSSYGYLGTDGDVKR